MLLKQRKLKKIKIEFSKDDMIMPSAVVESGLKTTFPGLVTQTRSRVTIGTFTHTQNRNFDRDKKINFFVDRSNTEKNRSP